MDLSCTKYVSNFHSQNVRPTHDGTVPNSAFVFSCQESNRVSLEDLFNPLVRRKQISSFLQRPTSHVRTSGGQADADGNPSSKSPIFMVGPEKLRAKRCSKDIRTDEILVSGGETSRRLQRVPSEESTTESSCDPDSLSHILRAAIQIKPSSSTATISNHTSKMSSPRTINNRNMPRRSRAIAIQRNPYQYDDQLEEEAMSQAENERLYDFATWRMYSRIVDHRRNQLQYSTKSKQATSGDGSAVSPTCVRQTTTPAVVLSTDGETSLEGEVFEFDF